MVQAAAADRREHTARLQTGFGASAAGYFARLQSAGSSTFRGMHRKTPTQLHVEKIPRHRRLNLESILSLEMGSFYRRIDGKLQINHLHYTLQFMKKVDYILALVTIEIIVGKSGFGQFPQPFPKII
jgi:hypothetical protein